MRNYLKNIEIVGAVLVYQEGDQCRWSLDWLYDNCDRVCIVLDNWNEKTKNVVMDYKKKYPQKTHIRYSDVYVAGRINEVQGQIKKRFKVRQAEIREIVIKELRKMHEQKPIDLLIWLDSDESPIDEFPKYLVDFWNGDRFDYILCGFIEPFDSMRILNRQKMAPHGRVYKYKPELSVYPWRGRTRYNPYYNEKKPWKLRHVIVHMCHLTEKYRQRREYFDNIDYRKRCERMLWFLPKDVRKMTRDEIADYQPGRGQKMPKNKPIPLEEYLDNRKYYLKKYNIKLK